MKMKDIANGPSKLCQALKITKTESDRLDLNNCPHLYLLDDCYDVNEDNIVSCGRIGIDNYGADLAAKPLRFYIAKHKCVSKF